MTHAITLLGSTFVYAPTPLQSRFAGRVICILVAVPLSALAFMPLIVQAARMW